MKPVNKPIQHQLLSLSQKTPIIIFLFLIKKTKPNNKNQKTIFFFDKLQRPISFQS